MLSSWNPSDLLKIFSFSGDEKDVAGHCKSLVILNVLSTKVTALGARLAIQHLPHLKFLQCDYSVQVLSKIYLEGLAAQPTAHHGHSSTQQPVTRRFSLMNLHCRNDFRDPSSSYVSGALFNALQLCPFVVQVDINLYQNQVFKDSDLLELHNLKNLHRLNLRYVHVSFSNGGILPILEKFGRDSLEVLKLGWLDEFDIDAIVRHCSNLRSLDLWEIKNCNIPPSLKPSAAHQLRHLEFLSIRHFRESQNEPTSSTLSFLLCSCPALVTIRLVGFKNLTDQVIKEAALAHGFKKLEHLRLSFCPRITKMSIDLFVFTLECPFKMLFLNCPQLRGNTEPVSNWRKKAQENNWNFDMPDY